MKRLLLVCLMSAVGFVASAPLAIAAKDRLSIISPHRKSMQDEFIPVFKEHYKKKYGNEVEVEWIDQGGTSDDLRFVRAKFKSNAKTANIDLFWGGGAATFMEMSNEKLLEKYELPAELAMQVPQSAAGVPLWDKTRSWYATAISSFGIFFNRKLVTMENLPEPNRWEVLADPKYATFISLTDPRRSGTATLMNSIVVQSLGWDKGWELLTRIAANTRSFTQMSSDPIKAVTSGDAIAAMAIDFYAFAKIADVGEKNLGFVLPQGQTVLDPDPIGILRGAPNRKIAERFIDFVLDSESQKLLMLKPGTVGGPKTNFLGRMAVNSKTYQLTEGQSVVTMNPFKQKPFLQLDLEKTAKVQNIFNDLVGATIVDCHKELKDAWTAAIKKKATDKYSAQLGLAPISEKDMIEMAAKWDNEVFRNQKINEWVKFAKDKYKKVQDAVMSH